MAIAHFLYRHYDGNNNLLYVGITNDLTRRTREHRAYSRWIKLSVSITSTSFDDRDDCYSAEERAIKNENPIFNIAFNNNYPARELGFRKNRAIALSMLKNASLRQENDYLKRENDLLRQNIEDLRQQITDEIPERKRLMQFLTHQLEQAKPTGSLYNKLFGRQSTD